MAFKNIKTKGVRKTRNRAAAKSIEMKLIGNEPLEVTDENYVRSLNWYNYTYDTEESQEFLVQYLKQTDANKDLIRAATRCPTSRMIATVGWQARMMFNGNTLNEKSYQFFLNRLDDIIKHGQRVRDEPGAVQKDKPSIQERTAAKNKQICGEIDSDVIDQRKGIYEYLVGHKITPAAANYIRAQYQNYYDEVMLDDEDVLESFGGARGLKAERTYWQSIMDDLDRYIGNKKAVKIRKPRAKKVKAAIDVVKKLKYQKEDPALKIMSINPAEIIGAQQLWTFNTKYRKLTVFNSLSPSGLSIKGTTLIGFDTDSSISKRARKPEETIKELLGAGKITLRRLMDTLNTSSTVPTGRINEDVILLRVIK